mgnify:CR=1 FL=1
MNDTIVKTDREISRRDFLEVAARFSVMFGLAPTLVGDLAKASERLFEGRAPVIWLQGQACSGCSISLLNTEDPGPLELITRSIALKYHPTLSAATGHHAIDIVEEWIGGSEDFVLVVEGSLPRDLKSACMVGEHPLEDLVLAAAQRATAVAAVGTCAAFGGVPSAAGNPTGAWSIPELLADKRIRTPLVRVPGCPSHPDWIVGTLLHLIQVGVPPVDDLQRPKAFYSRLIHETCQRYADYESERFAHDYGEPGCLFKLGCLGPITHADCNVRLWNSGAGSCIGRNAPCVGCASEHFAKNVDLALTRFSEDDDEGHVGR